MTETLLQRVLDRVQDCAGETAVVDRHGRRHSYAELGHAVVAAADALDHSPGTVMSGRAIVEPSTDLRTLALVLGTWTRQRSVVLLHPYLSLRQREDATAVAIGGLDRAACPASSAAEMLVALSSGTSGTPKLIARDHASWAATCDRSDLLWPISPQEVVWCPGPLDSTHFLYGAMHALTRGACVDLRADVDVVKPDVAYTTPTIAQRLTKSELPGSIRLVLSTGAPWPHDARAAFEARLTSSAETAHFYGASELSFVAWTSRDDTNTTDAARLIPGVEVRITPDQPSTETGQIHVRSDMLFTGYLTPDRVLDGTRQGWATVGDRGTLTIGGRLHLAGRTSRMFTRGGANVEPEAIETAVLRHPDIVQAACIALPDTTWGNVTGLAVVSDTLTPADVRSWCRAQLDVLHHPRRIVVLPALPVTHRGKTNHQALAAHFNDSTTE